MNNQDEIFALKILVGALVKANPEVRATLCIELHKALDQAQIQKLAGLEAALRQWISALDCKAI